MIVEILQVTCDFQFISKHRVVKTGMGVRKVSDSKNWPIRLLKVTGIGAI